MLLVLLPWLLVVLDKLDELASLASYDGSEDASSVPGVSIYGIGYGTTACLASRSFSLASGAG
jgi:hypothetical protein|uniref:Uncharacterized protein n=1 Tax=Picea glauca TaxID=3330 RepID=A0A101M299_PICGL|nr:hypothetical protein ABT39_MTgene2785 [Picea glauca]QHR89642.1 hypothetical protein Q903MT_gene3664 [Picea sitchensis]